MTVYCDTLRDKDNKIVGAHLLADALPELHYLARRIGLRREWFQDHPRHPHYDLTTARMRGKAIEAGALVMPTKAILLLLRLSRRAPIEYRRIIDGVWD